MALKSNSQISRTMTIRFCGGEDMQNGNLSPNSDIDRAILEDTLSSSDTNINESTYIYSDDTGNTGSHSQTINYSVCQIRVKFLVFKC